MEKSNDSSGGSPVMKVDELASYLRVHRSRFTGYSGAGRFPLFVLGSDWRFYVEAINAWRLGLSGEVDSAVKRPIGD